MKILRRPIFWFSTAMWLLSVVISALLIQLGSLVMSDIPTADKRLSRDNFVNTSQLQAVDTKISSLKRAAKTNQYEIEDAKFRLKYITVDYNTQRTNFDNWIKTRATTDSHLENPEVVQRVERLEQVKNSEREANIDLERLEQAKIDNERSLDDLASQRRSILNDAHVPYQKAKKTETFKVFLLRLAITIPLLLISGWMIFKKSHSNYWPIYRGFIIFSFFAFFVELVPYLPSYGGYVRYVAAILLSLVFAHFLIKWRERHLKTKKTKENQSKQQKQSSLKNETAAKKISHGVCPSCDNAFAKRKLWLLKPKQENQQDFCIHCGFSLFSNCNSCGTRSNSSHKFCGTCGTDSSNETAIVVAS